MIVHCLFEQSGTFKRAFRDAGHIAYDYDIADGYGQTDFEVDLFDEIHKAFCDNPSIFDKFTPDHLIMAFFPCTYFTDQMQLQSRGDACNMQEWSLDKKLGYSIGIAEQREVFYQTLCKMCIVAIRRNLQMIIENPYGKCNFLGQYLPIKPEIIHFDRRLFGDKFKKPTQYFFINYKRPFNLEQEVCNENKKSHPIEKVHGFERSIISQTYANLFVKNYI